VVQKLLEWMYQKEVTVAQTEVAVSALEEGGYTRCPRVYVRYCMYICIGRGKMFFGGGGGVLGDKVFRPN
jgi:hypothetical protein